jgi:NAD(P)-dependent dehydrogenase (short-subunit alcohol dehydrogenase family)
MTRTVYITGARRGIGRAVAREMASRKERIVGCSLHEEGLDELAEELRALGAPEVWMAAADVRDVDSISAWAREGSERVGRPEVMIHCAAVLGPKLPLLEIRPDAWRETIDINLTGAFCFLSATARLCRPKEPALWIWVTSSVGSKGRAEWGPYGASKAGVDNLNETWAAEIQNRPWTTTVINPGRTRTDMRRQAVPDEDPSVLPDPTTVAQSFAEIVDRWEKGEQESGAYVRARDLDPRLRR